MNGGEKLTLQVAPNRCQSGPLRAQSSSSRIGEGPMGREVRGDVEEVCGGQEGIGGLPARDWQYVMGLGGVQESVACGPVAQR